MTISNTHKIIFGIMGIIIFCLIFVSLIITNNQLLSKPVVDIKNSQDELPTQTGLPELAIFCGDSICNNGETCYSCPRDCGNCVLQQPPSKLNIPVKLKIPDKSNLGVTHYAGTAKVTYELGDGTSYTTTYDENTLNYNVIEGNYNRNIIENYRKGTSIDNLIRTFGNDRVQRFNVDGTIRPILYLTNTENGIKFSVKNYVAFADTSGVKSFASFIRDHSSDDNDFIRNILLVKSQVNTYTYNIMGEPRYPLETFLEGGGDCGASSIFVGSMLKSAHPEWTVKIWYVNSNSISTAPDSINHAIISVKTDRFTEFIETTIDDPDQALSTYDGKHIEGWSFEIQ